MTYKAKRNDQGHLVIKGVPIFCECKRGEQSYNRKWLEKAATAAKASEREGYFAPLHIRHHGDDGVRPAGFFRITGVREITFKGRKRAALFADLTITDPSADWEVVSSRLPWRSVEIFDVDKPNIDSLALLDHDPPYLELPMLMVRVEESEQDGSQIGQPEAVAFATFANPYKRAGVDADEPVVACFKRGTSARLFFHDDENATMDDDNKDLPAGDDLGTDKTGADQPKDKSEQFADDKPPIPPKDESGEGDGAEGGSGDGMDADVAAFCEAIKSGTISVSDMEAVKAAIIEQQSTVAAPADPTQNPQQAQAPVPGAHQMSKTDDTTSAQFKAMNDQIAELKGENAAFKKQLQERDDNDAKKVAVDKALQKFADRPMGADFRAELETNFDAMGADGFEKFVDTMANKLGKFRVVDDDDPDNNPSPGTCEEVLAYNDQGAKASERAAYFAAQHDELFKRGHTSVDKARYLELNMSEEGFKRAKVAQ